LPLNEEEEVKKYCQELGEKLNRVDLRVKTLSEKTLNYRIRQIYKKKIPYYLIIGREEITTKKIKLFFTYSLEISELTEKELIEKLQHGKE
jgi:threonyl-tRNA synthetase